MGNEVLTLAFSDQHYPKAGPLQSTSLKPEGSVGVRPERALTSNLTRIRWLFLGKLSFETAGFPLV